MSKLIPNLNVEPLHALLKHLKQTPDDLPELNMRNWGKDEVGKIVYYPSQTSNCCTCLCLLGRLPLLGFPAKEGECWAEYSIRVIGDVESEIWNYLFASDHPSTAESAVTRIQNVLAKEKALIGELYRSDYNRYLAKISN